MTSPCQCTLTRSGDRIVQRTPCAHQALYCRLSHLMHLLNSCQHRDTYYFRSLKTLRLKKHEFLSDSSLNSSYKYYLPLGVRLTPRIFWPLDRHSAPFKTNTQRQTPQVAPRVDLFILTAIEQVKFLHCTTFHYSFLERVVGISEGLRLDLCSSTRAY